MDNNSINNVNLPPGFRFYPTDEELVLHFLHRKKTPLLPFHPDVIPDLHLYSYDPWQLHGRALAEGNKWYYYSRRSTQNRVTHNGYWKPTGIEEPVFCSTKNNRIGIKKHFVFHMGESDSVGIKTNWIMHEFRLSHSSTNSSSSSSKIKSQPIKDYSKWVICRVYESKGDDDDDDGTDQLSCLDEVFLSSLDDFDEISLPNYN